MYKYTYLASTSSDFGPIDNTKITVIAADPDAAETAAKQIAGDLDPALNVFTIVAVEDISTNVDFKKA